MKEKALNLLNINLGHYGLRVHHDFRYDPSEESLYLIIECPKSAVAWHCLSYKLILSYPDVAVNSCITSFWLWYNGRFNANPQDK